MTLFSSLFDFFSGLILLNEDYFERLRDQVVQSQPSDKQTNMASWFKNLMDGIERNLLSKNRDRYVHVLTHKASIFGDTAHANQLVGLVSGFLIRNRRGPKLLSIWSLCKGACKYWLQIVSKIVNYLPVRY